MTVPRFLDLSANSIGGTIPTGITALTSLQFLYLARNAFSGSIPVGIGSMTALWFLDLSDQTMDKTGPGLSGTLPSSLGALTALQYVTGRVRVHHAVTCPSQNAHVRRVCLQTLVATIDLLLLLNVGWAGLSPCH